MKYFQILILRTFKCSLRPQCLQILGFFIYLRRVLSVLDEHVHKYKKKEISIYV